MMCFLGIDTSNYTTSVALSCDGRIEKNVRVPLKVSEGERGLRQSDAVFQHTVNIPVAFESLGAVRVDALGVSVSPRDNEGSYMPCFLSGVACASALSSTMGIPLYRFSHQAGHIAAALYSCGREDLHHSSFLAFHVSGGTTELTLVDNGRITLLGGTKDISAGKAIDRIGVKLGLAFPCGKALSGLCRDPFAVKPGRLSVDGLSFNLSGLENKAEKMIADGADKGAVADYTISHICAVIERLTENALSAYGELPVIYAGGVMSNEHIRERIESRFGGLFADSEFSCDNAAGISRLTELTHKGELKYAR